MHVSAGTTIALYYGCFIFIYYLTNRASTSPHLKLALSLPSILFVTLFPYWLETNLFVKFLLTVIGFFTSFNIVDLVFLDPPVQQLSFKDYMFVLSTSSRPSTLNQPAHVPDTLSSASVLHINRKVLARLGIATIKFVVFAILFESIQKIDYTNKSYLEYFFLTYVMGGGLYLCLTVIVDLIAIFWELVFNMKAKELFHAPFMASSPRDFWSRRWNMFFRDFFHKMFFRNYKSLSYLRATLSSLAIFAISGLLHEYVHWSIVGKLSGLNFMFFMLHGIVTTSQVIAQTLFPVLRHVPRAIGIVINSIFLFFTIPLFVGPYIQAGFVRNVSLPFTLMPTLHAGISQLLS